MIWTTNQFIYMSHVYPLINMASISVNSDFTKKLKIMSMIKGGLIGIGKDPDTIEKLLNERI
jgi:hypothetical protein